MGGVWVQNGYLLFIYLFKMRIFFTLRKKIKTIFSGQIQGQNARIIMFDSPTTTNMHFESMSDCTNQICIFVDAP